MAAISLSLLWVPLPTSRIQRCLCLWMRDTSTREVPGNRGTHTDFSFSLRNISPLVACCCWLGILRTVQLCDSFLPVWIKTMLYVVCQATPP
ncbi:hypothetical protein BJV78DRAFT_1241067 [Lactifluus subvellereus]|nr:hypothetical protein BJV78DRAFT_1241067 [Lactifluus subvellereus]